MELVVMILVSFPIGYLVRNRLTAFVAYTAVHAFVFTVQSVMLLVEWVGGSSTAFGPYPDGSTGEVFAYAVVNLVIYAVGLALVWLGGRTAARRASRAAEGIELDRLRA